jgi:hypothetical protein
MLKAPMVLALFGLSLNMLLWGVPGVVATSAAAHYVLPQARSFSDSLQHISGSPPITAALAQLVGAESDALQVAGEALQQPTPSDLAPRANAAGAHVATALQKYVSAVQELTRR